MTRSFFTEIVRVASVLTAFGPGVALAADAAAASYDANNLDDCTKKCDAGVGAACNDAGVILKTGKGGTAIDEARAATFYQRACDLKNAWGCTNLGALYKLGRGVTQDLTRSVALHKQACDLKNAQGCVEQGFFYSEGKGVPKDDARAVALFEQACSGGNAVGCRALGWHVAAGTGVAQDPIRAASLFQQACDGGEATGCGALGDVLVRGVGVPVDRAKGIAYLQKSCNAGNQFGCGKLRQFEVTPAAGQTVATTAPRVTTVVQSAPHGSVKVTLETDNPQVTLEHVLSESMQLQQVGKYTVPVNNVASSTVCGVPCNASVDPNWKYRIAGSGVNPSASFMLGSKDGDSLTLRVRPGSHGKIVGGILLVGVGGAFALLGAPILGISAAKGIGGGEAFGGVMLGVGVAMLVPGILLMTKGFTHVTTDSGRDLASAPLPNPAPPDTLFSF